MGYELLSSMSLMGSCIVLLRLDQRERDSKHMELSYASTAIVWLRREYDGVVQ